MSVFPSGPILWVGRNREAPSLARRREVSMTIGSTGVPPIVGTREDVHVTGRRVIATVVDGLLFGLLYTVMALLFGNMNGIPNEAFGWDAELPVLANLTYGAIIILYYVLMEGYLGQTVGKMLLGIKVVREDDGGVPGVGAATMRTVLRIVDGLFSYLVAFVTVLISGKNQRLGDMAAHTLVVRK